MSKRYNIGLLVASITDDFSRRITIGAMDAARAQDVNLVIFPGKYVGVQHINKQMGMEYEYQYNALFDVAAEAKLDYLIVAVGTIAYAHNKAYQRSFLDSLGDTPILCLAAGIEGYDILAFDNCSGVKEAVDYLAANGRKHIGMIAGDLNNEGFVQRYEAYRQALQDNGLAYQDSYMTPCPLFHRCYDEVEQLLDRNPELDAIVCATDLIAYDVYTVLERRHLRPGVNIAVVGFDDLPANARMNPPLASVRADAVQMGRRAVEKVVNRLRGVPGETSRIETRFVPRRSGYRYVDDDGLLENIFRGDYAAMRGRVEDYLRRRCEGATLEARAAEQALALVGHLHAHYVEQAVDESRIRESSVLLTEAMPLKADLGVDRLLHGVYVWLLRNCPADNVPYVQMLHRFFRREPAAETIAGVRKQYEQRAHMSNEFIRDALMFGGSLKSSYARPLKKLNDVGAVTAFLYTFAEPITNSYGDLFPTDLSWIFQAYSFGPDTFVPSPEEQAMTTRQVFDNDHLCVNRQHIFIVADLFTEETQYGVALLEPRDEDFLDELEMVTYQLTTAVRSLNFLKKQKKLVDELHATNQALEQLAKIDEQTGLYNRNGFFQMAEELIRDPRHQCQPFMICYADIDNLKQINNLYGHAEGDFTIRLAAECLRHTLGEDAVIGRMGGDEFIAVVPAPSHVTVESVSERKELFTQRFNGSGKKPYAFGLTLGMFKSVCGNSQELTTALDRADDLLYAGKGPAKKPS